MSMEIVNTGSKAAKYQLMFKLLVGFLLRNEKSQDCNCRGWGDVKRNGGKLA